MISSAEIGAVARDLAEAGSGLRWIDEGLRELVGRLGWEWAGESDGRVRVVTALPGGDAALVPVDVRARPWAGAQQHLELMVPLSRPAADVPAQVEEFRRIADALRRALGDATYVGGNGWNSPSGYRLAPTWGRPFLWWRRGATSLELRAGEAGPELVLQASAVWESWYQQGGDGYVGVRQGAGCRGGATKLVFDVADEPRRTAPPGSSAPAPSGPVWRPMCTAPGRSSPGRGSRSGPPTARSIRRRRCSGVEWNVIDVSQLGGVHRQRLRVEP